MNNKSSFTFTTARFT